MGRKPSQPIVATVKRGNLRIEIRRYGARFGFSYVLDGKSRRVRLATLEQATERGKEIARCVVNARLDVLDIDPLELAEFRRWEAQQRKAPLLSAVMGEFLATKRVDVNLNRDYVRNLNAVLRRLCAALEDCRISQVTAAQIEGFISVKAPRNRNNERAAIISLFRFARGLARLYTR